MNTLDVGTESEATESFAVVFIGGFGLFLYLIVDLFGKLTDLSWDGLTVVIKGESEI